MLSENGDVIKIDTTMRQTTRPWVSKMADGRYGRKRYENDKCGRKYFWKRISVDRALVFDLDADFKSPRHLENIHGNMETFQRRNNRAHG